MGREALRRGAAARAPSSQPRPAACGRAPGSTRRSWPASTHLDVGGGDVVVQVGDEAAGRRAGRAVRRRQGRAGVGTARRASGWGGACRRADAGTAGASRRRVHAGELSVWRAQRQPPPPSSSASSSSASILRLVRLLPSSASATASSAVRRLRLATIIHPSAASAGTAPDQTDSRVRGRRAAPTAAATHSLVPSGLGSRGPRGPRRPPPAPPPRGPLNMSWPHLASPSRAASRTCGSCWRSSRSGAARGCCGEAREGFEVVCASVDWCKRQRSQGGAAAFQQRLASGRRADAEAEGEAAGSEL